MNFIRQIHHQCMTNENDMALPNLRQCLHRLSQSIIFTEAKHASPRFPKVVTFDHVMSTARSSRVVLFGEQHHQPDILKAQMCVLERMVTQNEQESRNKTSKAIKVAIVLEMFNWKQQPLLDAFKDNKISLEELEKEYSQTEGFFISKHYGFLLQAAKEMDVQIIAGFAPKKLCQNLIVKGKEEVIDEMQKLGAPKDLDISGTEEHYNYFQGLISGNMSGKTEKYRKIFPAQILRDISFAHKINEVVQKSEDIKVLGICGSGHVDHGFGVPERITNGVSILTITSREKQSNLEHNVADFVFLYDDIDW